MKRSYERLQNTVDFVIGAGCVTRRLNEAGAFRGYPPAVRTENVPEFTSLKVVRIEAAR
jgi:hypothetical protein